MKRFINPRQKWILWNSANGKCQICGEQLPDNWHADHIEPYSKTKRTNIFEMQALCPKCNLKKGSKENFMQEINLEKARPGQKEAIKTIIERVTKGESYTACVLPTRYGKSDVIRVSGIVLFQKNQICASLILNPDKLLRNQIIKTDKFNECLNRYSINLSNIKIISLIKKIPANQINPNNEIFISTTMQLINENIGYFEDWVDHCIFKTRKPPLIFIDESHTASEDNKWGEDVKRLVECGAKAVLLTATPIRGDGKKIPGFDFEILSEESTKVYISKPGPEENLIKIDVYEGIKQKIKLIAHHTTPFRQAWNEDAICKISRWPFDVDLSKTSIKNGNYENISLSELQTTKTRSLLGKIVKDHLVIKEGVKRLVKGLKIFRKMNSLRNCAGIIFCGNDDEPIKRVNAHANEIRQAIEKIDNNFQIVIATSSDGNDGIKKIEDFSAGKGDILIVKQMAGRGIDVPRLKIALDLSPIRTAPAYIQRIMRIATLYEHLIHAIYIAPDDCIGKALFQNLISDEGGESSLNDLTKIDSYIKEKEEKETPVFCVENILDTNFEDSLFNKTESIKYPQVEQLLNRFPELSSYLTYSEIALRCEGLKFLSGVNNNIQNTVDEAEDLRKDINYIANKIIKSKMFKIGEYNGEIYKSISIDIFNQAKKRCSIPLDMPISTLNDIQKLKDLKRTFEIMDAEDNKDAASQEIN